MLKTRAYIKLVYFNFLIKKVGIYFTDYKFEFFVELITGY